LKDYFVENGVYAILNGVRAQPYSSFLRTWRRRPTPSAARGHAKKKIIIKKMQIIVSGK